MTRYNLPEICCDAWDGCGEVTKDFYSIGTTAINGSKITSSTRAPGWFSTINEDYCPKHIPWKVRDEQLRAY